MSTLELRRVSKRFGDVQAVDDVSLTIDGPQLITLLGPSGCGKTTTLRLIGGLERADSGAIIVNGTDVSGQPASRRGMGFVFQAYALFPNLTGNENIAYGLRIRHVPQTEIDRKVARLVELTHLGDAARRYPHQLSGGQQQRVALARALAIEPSILLLDEPLSALDASVRVALRGEIRRLQLALGIPTVYVTHDQEEAMSISDRVVVMRDGRIVQDDAPESIYGAPANPSIATFIGTANRLEGQVGAPGSGTVRWRDRLFRVAAVDGLAAGGAVTLIVRPERMMIEADSGELGPGGIAGRVSLRSFHGAVTRLSVESEGHTFLVDVAGGTPFSIGDQVRLSFPPDAGLVFPVDHPEAGVE